MLQLRLEELVGDVLGYTQEPAAPYRSKEEQFEPEMVHLFRTARRAGVKGIYVFQASPGNQILPPRPAVYVAEASSREQAREIHRSLWNLGYAPFLIVLLPEQVRVYTTFDYSVEATTPESGLLAEPDLTDPNLTIDTLRQVLADFTAYSIDTGRIWGSDCAQNLDASRRVDRRLLKHLESLSRALQRQGLSLQIAHALIGQYVYIRYLLDREVVSQEWLERNGVALDDVLGGNATAAGLRHMVEMLEARFNGDVFPIDFESSTAPSDKHVAEVASILSGGKFVAEGALQLPLSYKGFNAYDFRYIPIETLSAIYEQFLRAEGKGKEIGAIYTPEVAADYLLAEVNSISPLQGGMKVLDPACGSGIFLVLAYRRLIELELAQRDEHSLPLASLRSLLLDSIYGVEREPNACRVAELSLILTLLNYADADELLADTEFRFPSLHNTRIFESDFFDDQSAFWQESPRFDWIVGNPPWTKADPNEEQDQLTCRWIAQNRKNRPVGRMRVAEAFSWRVGDLLGPKGVVGLLHHATSLFNSTSETYRKRFFQAHEVLRVTNLSNLRDVLFGGRSSAPAATIVYRKSQEGQDKPSIVHYGPLLVNQASRVTQALWTITINESEVQPVSPQEAEGGKCVVWKLALWGTHRDKRALEQIRHQFPTTLAQLCKAQGWEGPSEGPQLRDIRRSKERLMPCQEIEGVKCLNLVRLNATTHYLTIPDGVLEDIPPEKRYLRIEGGSKGLKSIHAPHIFISSSWKDVIYSDQDFVNPSRQWVLAAPSEDADYLRALSIWLRSSLVRYYMFFHVPEWGVFRQAKRGLLGEAEQVPVPLFTAAQIERLSRLHGELIEEEKQRIQLDPSTPVGPSLQAKIDERVNAILDIPANIRVLVEDFVQMRMPLDQGKEALRRVTRCPDEQQLLTYAETLRNELDRFAGQKAHHKVAIAASGEFIECVVSITDARKQLPINVQFRDLRVEARLADIHASVGQRVSQWVYVQRGLRIFSGPTVRMYKTPRLTEWTRTQALNDADDLIAEILSA